MFKRYYKIILAALALVVVFNTSFLLGMQKYKNYQTKKSNPANIYEDDIDRAAINDLNGISSTSDNATVSEDAEVVFILKNKNINQSIIKSQEKVSESMVGKEKADIENLYEDEGYVLESISSNKIIYVNEVQGYKYDKNKYFLGINNGYLVIYHTDGNGNINVEDKDKNIKNAKKIIDLPKEFQEELLKGSSNLQYDSLYDAEGAYNDCISWGLCLKHNPIFLLNKIS